MSAMVIFHTGQSANPTENVLLKSEAAEWNDIVQHSITEHPYNSTLKTLSVLKWFQNELSQDTVSL